MLVQAQAFLADAVDVGCVHVWISVDSQVAIALVVGQKRDYVWLFTGHFCASGQDIYGQPICLVRVARPEVFRIVHTGCLRRVRRQCPVGFVLFDQGKDILMGDSIFQVFVAVGFFYCALEKAIVVIRQVRAEYESFASDFGGEPIEVPGGVPPIGILYDFEPDVVVL